MKLYSEEERLKLIGDRLNLSHTVFHCYESDPEPGQQSETKVYLEQGEAGKNYAQLQFVSGMGQFCLTFLDSKALKSLSNFLMEAAQKLEFCTKEEQ